MSEDYKHLKGALVQVDKNGLFLLLRTILMFPGTMYRLLTYHFAK